MPTRPPAAPSAPPARPWSSPALTVVIALAGLSVVGIPFLGQMGVAAAGTVAVAVLIALTLLPALLGFAGRAGRRRPRPAARRQPVETRRHRRALGTVRRPPPVAVLLVALAGLGRRSRCPRSACSLGLPNDSTAAPAATQRKAYDARRAAASAPASTGRCWSSSTLGRRTDRAGAALGAGRGGHREAAGRRRRDAAQRQPGRRHGAAHGHPEERRRAARQTEDLVDAIRDRLRRAGRRRPARSSPSPGTTAVEHRRLRRSWPTRCCPTSRSSSGWRSCC